MRKVLIATMVMMWATLGCAALTDLGVDGCDALLAGSRLGFVCDEAGELVTGEEAAPPAETPVEVPAE